MLYPEFLTSVLEACERDKLILRALGMTASTVRFGIIHSDVSGIVQPTVAVLSSDHELPLSRTYQMIATNTVNHTVSAPKYPLVRVNAEVQPPLAPEDFVGDFEKALSEKFVWLQASDDVLTEPIKMCFLDGNPGSLIVKGFPTYPPEVTEALAKLY